MMKKLIPLAVFITALLSGNLSLLLGIIFGIGIPFLILMTIANVISIIVGKHDSFIKFASKLKQYGFQYDGYAPSRKESDDNSIPHDYTVALEDYHNPQHAFNSSHDFDAHGPSVNPSTGLHMGSFGVDSAGNPYGSGQ